MLRQKLKSNTGASLSMALLLFLVCAVVGAVVLTAATVTAGRVKDIAESDQRYFSVSSAAQLLAKQMSDTTVTITREKQEVTTTTTTVTVVEVETENGEKVPVASSSTDSTTETTYSAAVSSVGSDFIKSQAEYLLFKDDENRNTADIMNYIFHMSTDRSPINFSMTVSQGTGTEMTDMLVSGTVTMKKDGTLVFEFANGDQTTAKRYTLRLTMTPKVTETPGGGTTSSGPVTSVSGDATIYTDTTTVTTTKTSKIAWLVDGIEKVVAEDENA